MFVIIALVCIAADQISKAYIESRMNFNRFTVIPKILDIAHVRNTGAAFGMLKGKTGLLTVVTCLMIVGLTVYVFVNKKNLSKLEIASLALICGGGVGNLISRLRFGYVTDFIDIHILPVFNLADICITCGCALLVVAVLINDFVKQGIKPPGESDV